MDGAVVGDNCIIGGHTIITERAVIPANSIVMGSPGKIVRTNDNFDKTHRNALIYWRNALAYARGEHRAWADPELDAWVEEEMRKAHAARRVAAE
jgi:carbonic anhydrase/acetyltransferase-like protein (isoleucine patch superfamily)